MWVGESWFVEHHWEAGASEGDSGEWKAVELWAERSGGVGERSSGDRIDRWKIIAIEQVFCVWNVKWVNYGCFENLIKKISIRKFA